MVPCPSKTSPRRPRAAGAPLLASAAVLLGYVAQASPVAPWLRYAFAEGTAAAMVGVALWDAPQPFAGPRGRASLRAAARTAACVLPAWVLLRSLALGAWHFTLPPATPATLGAAAWACYHHVVVVALPEELFWRGYVQRRLCRAWAPQARRQAAWRTPAAWLACALFAGSHVAGGGDVWRLATFVPGLLFARAYAQQGSVAGPWALHAACNLVALACEATLPPPPSPAGAPPFFPLPPAPMVPL